MICEYCLKPADSECIKILVDTLETPKFLHRPCRRLITPEWWNKFNEKFPSTIQPVVQTPVDIRRLPVLPQSVVDLYEHSRASA